MKKVKKINNYLIVVFNARERDEYRDIGNYGVIAEETYTGDLDQDRGELIYDDIDTLKKAIQKVQNVDLETVVASLDGPWGGPWDKAICDTYDLLVSRFRLDDLRKLLEGLENGTAVIKMKSSPDSQTNCLTTGKKASNCKRWFDSRLYLYMYIFILAAIIGTGLAQLILYLH